MFLFILLALTTTVSMATPASTPSPSPVLGSLQPDQIRTVARENSQRIRDCWDAVPVDKRDIGKVIVRWVIDGTGHVTQAAPADESPTLPAGFGECLSAEIRRWTFPRPKGGGIVIVHYPFVFRATGGAPAPRASAAADDIAAAIDASPDVARCFDELVTRVPDAHGLVSIRVVVGADGSVVRSRLVSSTRISPELRDEPMSDCMRAAVMRLRLRARATFAVFTVVHPLAMKLTPNTARALADVWAPAIDETQDAERCRNDDKDACTRIGVGFDTGRRPDTASKANARQFYARGCELFSAIACNNLGVLVGRGFAGPGDLDRRAMPFYEEACSMGYAPGCSSVARRLVRDPQQAARGRAMLQQQCSTGLGAACDDLGLHLLPTEPARAVAFFREACAADNDQCDSALRAGVVAPEQQKSVRAAVVSLCIASDPTLETDSCKVAGVANLCGFGGPVNEAQGLSLLERACVASRKPGACTLYAEALVEQTSPKAVDVARVACDAGDVDGCALVAHLSDGTVREALLAEACAQGSWRACRAASGGAFAVGACRLPIELKPAL